MCKMWGKDYGGNGEEACKQGRRAMTGESRGK